MISLRDEFGARTVQTLREAGVVMESESTEKSRHFARRQDLGRHRQVDSLHAR